MKKKIALILTSVLCMSLWGCGHSHKFSDWTVSKEASCTEDGLKARTCECGEEETEVIAGGHSFTEATMFAPKTCTTCGTTEGEALATVIAVGDTAEAEDHSFKVDSIKFTDSLSEKRGNITYKHSSDHVLAIKLDFKNLSTEAFERWSSDRVEEISMEYQGKYQYEGEYWVPADDIVPLANDVMYIVYEVPKTMAEDENGAIQATFTIDGETYAVTVQEGDGSAAEESDDAVASDVSGELAVGKVVSNDTTFSFKVDELYYTNKPSYKTGNITYSYSTDGYSLVCKLDFTNLDSEVMTGFNSDRIKDLNLNFAGKYDYEGSVWIPANEIVPLDNGYVFLVFEVAESVEESTDSLEMTFVVDGNEFHLNCR